jgi:hypothetical protein
MTGKLRLPLIALGTLVAGVIPAILVSAAPPPSRYVSELYPHTVNSNTVAIQLEAVGETPEFVAVRVEPGGVLGTDLQQQLESWRAAMKTNRSARFVPPTPTARPATVENPKWLAFQTNILVDLGPGEGKRRILFAYKYKGQPHDGHWSGSSINVQRGTPTLWIVNPTNFFTSQPMIQLQGLTSARFDTLRLDQFDSKGTKVATPEHGLGTSFPGGYEFPPLANYFSYLDLDLSPGTNTFVFHGTDEFGNEMTTNFVIVFSTADDHTPPRIELGWPLPNAELAGAGYTIRGRLDDFTARLVARIQTKNGLTTHDALVERSGHFWLEEIPLTLDTNQITLVATDAAGNRSETNFTVFGREGPVITMDPVNPPDLWKKSIAVTGRVTPPENNVWINGVQAKVKPDGTWSAQSVPVLSPSYSTAVFEMSAHPRGGAVPKKTAASEVLSAQASLSAATNAIILNASAPACGFFHLRINETMGLSFVVLASTNLTHWTPILTNLNADPTFDYTLRSTNHECRFFKLAPMR